MNSDKNAFLIEKCNETLVKLPAELDKVRKSQGDLLRAINSYKSIIDDENELIINQSILYLENLNKLGKCRILLGLLTLDLTTSLKIQLKAEHRYEELFALKQMIVIIKEGFTQIYHYNDKGRVDKSYWINYFDKLINNDLPELKEDYDNLSAKLKDFLNEYFSDKTIKDERDLFVHYDLNAEKVYDVLVRLDVEEKVNVFISFRQLIQDIYFFTDRMILYYRDKSNNEIAKTDSNLDALCQKYEELKVSIASNKDKQTRDFLQTKISMLQSILKYYRDLK